MTTKGGDCEQNILGEKVLHSLKHGLSADYKWLHNTVWADDHDLFHSSYIKSLHAADKWFQAHKTVFLLNIKFIEPEGHTKKHILDANGKSKTQKDMYIVNVKKSDRAHSNGYDIDLCRLTLYRWCELVGEGLPARGQERWPGFQFATWETKATDVELLLLLQCNNPEAARAAVIEATEEKVLP